MSAQSTSKVARSVPGIETYYDNGAYQAYEEHRANMAARVEQFKKQSTTARVFRGQSEAQFEAELKSMLPPPPIKQKFEEGEVKRLAIAKVKKKAEEDRNVILQHVHEKARSFLREPMTSAISNQKNEHLAAASIVGIVVPNNVPGSKGTFIEWFRANYDTEVHLSTEGVSLPKLKPQIVNERLTDNGEMIFARARYLIEKDGKPALGDLDSRFNNAGGVAKRFTREEIRDHVHDIAKKTFAFQAEQQKAAMLQQQRQRGVFAQAAASAGRVAQAIPQMMPTSRREQGNGYAPRGFAPA
ncbi:hypothetical protein [Rhizobium laguerreae]|uniref:hypothetical protein n=1 Tax=Rhizobium laguerreae TaxID=1076926 RepID=UPI001C9165C8|nr:hypothetical protein [Rhizobium laguerreae]MBY3314710.1 hypothetical protein [Rhizobium laguerreae]